MMKIKISLCCVMLILTTGYGETLEETVAKVVSINPQVKEAYYDLEASKAELEVVQALRHPTLDLRGEYGREGTKNTATQQEKLYYDEKQLSLTGRYNLLQYSDYSEVNHKISEKESLVELSTNKFKEKTNSISFLVIQVYLELLRKKELLNIARENHTLHINTLNKVTLRVEVGDGYESDVKQTEARVDLAETNKIIAETNYLNAQINYQRLTRHSADVDGMLEPIEVENLSSLNVDESIAEAKNKNFKIQMKEANSKIATSIFKQQKSKFYPTLDLEMSGNLNENVYGIEGKDDSAKIALVMNYNIYKGGADSASKLAALKRRDMTLKGIEEVEFSAEELIRISLLKYRMFSKQIQLVGNQLAHLDRTRELYEMEYRNSKRTIIDVLNVKQEYNYAQSQKINMKYDKLLVYYQFKSVMGELLEEFHLDLIDNLPVKNVNENKYNDNFEELDVLFNALDSNNSQSM